MIDGYDDNFSTTDRTIYVKPASINPPNIYIKSKWLDEKKDQYANVFIDDKPLIRCKDCKYWKEDVPHNAYCEIMKIHGFEPDDFCSRGERR